jgi:hypothetical protein
MRVELRPVLLLLAMAVVGTASCAPHGRVPPPVSTVLQCGEVTTPETATDTIGPGGGRVGLARGHGAIFPAGALNPPARPVSVREAQGRYVGFQMTLTPAAPQFNQDVWVIISLANCTPEQVGDTTRWKIHRRAGVEGPGVALPTGRQGNTLYAVTRANSFFIVAD